MAQPASFTLEQRDKAVESDSARPRPWAVVLLWTVILLAALIPLAELVRQIRRPAPNAFAFDEDAYYYFSVARSIVAGHGLTADGSHATSGVQALWALVLVGPFVFYRHIKLALALVGLESMVCWLWAASSFSAILSNLAPSRSLSRREVRLLFAAVFVLSRGIRVLSWNGLETGLYLAVLLHVASRYLFDRHAKESSDIGFAVWIAVLALARADAVVLIVGLVVARAWLYRRQVWKRAVAWPLIAAGAALLPQIAWDLWVAGSPLPQSGLALSAPVFWFGLSTNVRYAYQTIPSIVLWPLVPHQHFLTIDRLIGIAGVVGLIELGLIRGIGIRRDRLVVVGGFGALALAIGAAYVFQSSAPYFYVRYFAPLELVALGATALAVWRITDFLASREWGAPPGTIAGIAAVTLVSVALVAVGVSEPRAVSPGYLGAELLSLPTHHEYDGCRDIGMFESGRVGYVYPDRVVNLDGVVNAAALRASLDGHRLDAYLAAEHIDVIYLLAHMVPTYLNTLLPTWQRDWRLVPDARVPEALFLVRRGAACAATSSASLRSAAPPTPALANRSHG